MCGIVAGQSSKIKKWQINSALEKIKKRGPDASKIMNIGDSFLGFNLLGISSPKTDLLSQPFCLNDLTVCVNGEIYNHLELKKDLLKHSVVFKSDSDCEVVLHGLAIYGESFLKRLNGEFAIVAYWSNKKEWLCAVDHVGTKPLKYFLNHQDFFIASSAAALKELGVVLSIDRNSLLFSFHTHCLPSATSLFKDIKTIPPGHFLKIKNNVANLKQYRIDPTIDSKDIERLLEEAVKIRIPKYHRPALTLSGGIDSCIIALYLKKLGVDFNCYSINFPESEYSEINEINLFCQKYDIKTNIINMSEKDIINLYPEAIINSENISINPHAAGKLLINKIISKDGHRVCFTGDGSDELFFGYSHFHTNDEFQFLRDSTNIGAQFGQLLLPEYRNKLLTSNLFEDYKSINPDPSVQELYYHYWLNEYGLKILGDSQSSNESIEYRYPFVDVNLISNLKKIEDLHRKNYPSKKMLRDIIPDKELSNRKKKPFIAPFINKNWIPLFEKYVYNNIEFLDSNKTKKYIERLNTEIKPSSVILSQLLSFGILNKELCNV